MLKIEKATDEHRIHLVQTKWVAPGSRPSRITTHVVESEGVGDDDVFTVDNAKRMRPTYKMPLRLLAINFGLLLLSLMRSYLHLEKYDITAPAKKKSPVEKAPGFGMARLLGHFCTKNFRQNVLESMHAEMLADYYEHLEKKDFQRARWIKRLMGVHFLRALGTGFFWRAIDLVTRRKSSTIE